MCRSLSSFAGWPRRGDAQPRRVLPHPQMPRPLGSGTTLCVPRPRAGETRGHQEFLCDFNAKTHTQDLFDQSIGHARPTLTHPRTHSHIKIYDGWPLKSRAPQSGNKVNTTHTQTQVTRIVPRARTPAPRWCCIHVAPPQRGVQGTRSGAGGGRARSRAGRRNPYCSLQWRFWRWWMAPGVPCGLRESGGPPRCCCRAAPAMWPSPGRRDPARRMRSPRGQAPCASADSSLLQGTHAECCSSHVQTACTPSCAMCRMWPMTRCLMSDRCVHSGSAPVRAADRRMVRRDAQHTPRQVASHRGSRPGLRTHGARSRARGLRAASLSGTRATQLPGAPPAQPGGYPAAPRGGDDRPAHRADPLTAHSGSHLGAHNCAHLAAHNGVHPTALPLLSVS
eukprot:m.34652 g.34652  ORF g.34652 m.34652 type:complete len:393 (+) comp5245_c0_seq1:1010-2188(+)